MKILPRIIKIRVPAGLEAVHRVGTELPHTADKAVDVNGVKALFGRVINTADNAFKRKFGHTPLHCRNLFFLAFSEGDHRERRFALRRN